MSFPDCAGSRNTPRQRKHKRFVVAAAVAVFTEPRKRESPLVARGQKFTTAPCFTAYPIKSRGAHMSDPPSESRNGHSVHGSWRSQRVVHRSVSIYVCMAAFPARLVEQSFNVESILHP